MDNRVFTITSIDFQFFRPSICREGINEYPLHLNALNVFMFRVNPMVIVPRLFCILLSKDMYRREDSDHSFENAREIDKYTAFDS